MESLLSYDEYRVLVEQSPILIWRANTTGACDYFNHRWLAFRGRTMAQEHGDGWAQGVHPADFVRCVDTYRNAFAARAAFEMEYRLMRHDAVYRWIFDRGSPFYLTSGEFGGYIGSCIDITDRIEAQEALHRKRVAELAELHKLLPICAYCHKVRDDYGYWKLVEEYVRAHSRTEFTHGICPECLAAMMPGMDG